MTPREECAATLAKAASPMTHSIPSEGLGLWRFRKCRSCCTTFAKTASNITLRRTFPAWPEQFMKPPLDTSGGKRTGTRHLTGPAEGSCFLLAYLNRKSVLDNRKKTL